MPAAAPSGHDRSPASVGESTSASPARESPPASAAEPADRVVRVTAESLTRLMGALSVDAAMRCLNAREIDGLVVGDGLPARSVEALFVVLSEDSRFRDLPIAALGASGEPQALPNFIRAAEPLVLIERLLPLVRSRAFERLG